MRLLSGLFAFFGRLLGIHETKTDRYEVDPRLPGALCDEDRCHFYSDGQVV